MKVAIEYHAPVSRPWQLIAGLLLCPLALAALAVGYAGAAIALSGGPLPPGAAVVYPGFAFVGIGGLVLSARLVLRSPAWIIELAAPSSGCTLACFTLAGIRGRLDADYGRRPSRRGSGRVGV